MPHSGSPKPLTPTKKPNQGLPDVVPISDDKNSMINDSAHGFDHKPVSQKDVWINHPDLLNDESENQPSPNLSENYDSITVQDD